MIVGHLAFAGLAKRTFFKTQNLPYLILASYGPDLLDKTGSVLLGHPGRYVGHSLVVFFALGVLGWIACRALRLRQEILLAGALMWLAHLMGDFVRPTVLLWPFLDPIVGHPFDASGAIHRMYVELLWPGQLTLEIVITTLLVMPSSLLERMESLSVFRTLDSVYRRGVALKHLQER